MSLLDFFTNDSLFADFDRINAFSRGTWQIGGPRWHTRFLEDDAPQVFRPRVNIREDKEKHLVSRSVPAPHGTKPEEIRNFDGEWCPDGYLSPP